MSATTTGGEATLAERLRAAEARRDALEDAIHVIAHDLRGQIGAVLGYADLLERRLDGTDAKARGYADTIARVSEQLAQQVDRMMAVYGASRRDVVPEDVEVGAVVRTVVDDLHASGERTDVRVEVADGVVVHADPLLLRVVLEQLLTNAWKATRDTLAPVVDISGRPVGDRLVELTVRDNGIGFDLGQADRLFVPTGRLHPVETFPGVGLGLASVARIVERHGGTVSVDSEPGAGASFSVVFPAPTTAVRG